METGDPWAIMPVACGAPLDLLHLLRIDEEDLETPRLQERKEWDPIDPSRFHGDGGHATVNEPVGEGVEVDGERAETAHGLGVAPRRHGDPMLGFADVDARGVGVADLEGVGEHG